MMLLATLVPDGVGWGVDFLLALLVGWHPLAATGYMFDQGIPAFLRSLSLFH